MNNKNNCVIFSVYQTGNEENHNYINHLAVKSKLQEIGAPFKELKGKYGGEVEQSFLVELRNVESEIKLLDFITSIITEYNQESILYLHADRTGELRFTATGERQTLGKLTEVTAELAVMQEAFTWDPLTDTYYIFT